MTGVCGAHHVLGVPHLLGELGHSQRAVLLGAAAGQGGEADHEEVQAGEGDQVDGQLAQVSVQLTREAQGAGDAAHDGRDEVVQVTKGGGGQLQGAEADVVQGLVVLHITRCGRKSFGVTSVGKASDACKECSARASAKNRRHSTEQALLDCGPSAS